VHRRRILSKGLSQLRQTDCPIRLQVLASRLIAECGGQTRMVRLAQQPFEEPGRSGFRQQLIASVIHLMLKADESQAHTPSDRVPEMSTEELNAAFQWRVEKLIKAQPTVAVDALRSVGWTVTPPEQ
jgi:hypothetical protein